VSYYTLAEMFMETRIIMIILNLFNNNVSAAECQMTWTLLWTVNSKNFRMKFWPNCSHHQILICTLFNNIVPTTEVMWHQVWWENDHIWLTEKHSEVSSHTSTHFGKLMKKITLDISNRNAKMVQPYRTNKWYLSWTNEQPIGWQNNIHKYFNE
jgi:hypothetical protein